MQESTHQGCVATKRHRTSKSVVCPRVAGMQLGLLPPQAAPYSRPEGYKEQQDNKDNNSRSECSSTQSTRFW